MGRMVPERYRDRMGAEHASVDVPSSPTSRDRLFWALPPVIPDDDLPFFRDQIQRLQRTGHNRWLVANWAHFHLFAEPTEVLIADYTFNVLNSQASTLLKEMGCQALILSLENDRANLQKLVPAIQGITPLLRNV